MADMPRAQWNNSAISKSLLSFELHLAINRCGRRS